jgi:hypothetical protein
MNRKMIGEAINIRVSDKKIKSDSHETWKCADPELERQIRCFPTSRIRLWFKSCHQLSYGYDKRSTIFFFAVHGYYIISPTLKKQIIGMSI